MYLALGLFMKTLQIDIVSDVVCPWCAIGFANLNTALKELDDPIEAQIKWHPFQLNPYMSKEGQDINEHLSEKYGLSESKLAENKQHIRQIGQNSGVEFKFEERARIYNTLDCHVLLHWAGEKGKQTQLKLALFKAYFSEGKDISQQDVLLDVVASVGLEKQDAQIVLKDEQYKNTVKDEESKYKSMGIQSVPAFIINNEYLLSGGQPSDVFKQSLQDILAKG
jgi:predicted DsbA family dithiol-disulfide isomerase